MALVTDIGEPATTRSFNQLANTGRMKIGKELGIQTRVYETKTRGGPHPERGCGRSSGLRPHLRRRLPELTAVNAVAAAVPEHTVRRHRRWHTPSSTRSRRTAAGQVSAEQEAGYPRRLPRGPRRGEEARAAHRSSAPSARNQDPAIVQLHRRLPVQGAKQSQPEDQGSHQLRERPDLRRPAEVQGDRARARSRKDTQVDLPGRRRLRPRRSARSEGDAGIWGIGVDADQAYLGPHHPDERAQARGQGVYGPDQARVQDGKLEDAGDYRLQPRRTAASDSAPINHEGAEGVRRQDARGREADRVRQDQGQADDQDQGSNEARRFQGVRRPAPWFHLGSGRRIAPHGRRDPVLELRGDHEAVPGGRRQRPREPRPSPRRGARAARRERRRQVDADEHPLRALPAGRGRDPHRRQAGRRFARRGDAIARGIGMVHQHFMLIPAHDGGREHRARHRADDGGRPPRLTRAATSRVARALAAASASRSTPTRRVERHLASASSSASRS